MVRNIRKYYIFYSYSKNKKAGRGFLCPLFYFLPAVFSARFFILQIHLLLL